MLRQTGDIQYPISHILHSSMIRRYSPSEKCGKKLFRPVGMMEHGFARIFVGATMLLSEIYALVEDREEDALPLRQVLRLIQKELSILMCGVPSLVSRILKAVSRTLNAVKLTSKVSKATSPDSKRSVPMSKTSLDAVMQDSSHASTQCDHFSSNSAWSSAVSYSYSTEQTDEVNIWNQTDGEQGEEKIKTPVNANLPHDHSPWVTDLPDADFGQAWDSNRMPQVASSISPWIHNNAPNFEIEDGTQEGWGNYVKGFKVCTRKTLQKSFSDSRFHNDLVTQIFASKCDIFSLFEKQDTANRLPEGK